MLLCSSAPPLAAWQPARGAEPARAQKGDCAASWRLETCCVKRSGAGRGQSSRPRAKMVGPDGVGAGGLQPHVWWAPGRCERCKRAKKGAQYCFGTVPAVVACPRRRGRGLRRPAPPACLPARARTTAPVLLFVRRAACPPLRRTSSVKLRAHWVDIDPGGSRCWTPPEPWRSASAQGATRRRGLCAGKRLQEAENRHP